MLKAARIVIDSNNFMIIYGLLNLIIENIESKNLKERTINIFIGNFKNYLTSNENFKASELQNFFLTINLFLTKIKLNKETREKLFKMNLKLFESSIKRNYDVNPTLLTISKYYNTILSSYLKEYDVPKNIDSFISEIKSIITNDNQIVSLNTKEISEIDPETLNFNFISDKIRKSLVNDFLSMLSTRQVNCTFR